MDAQGILADKEENPSLWLTIFSSLQIVKNGLLALKDAPDSVWDEEAFSVLIDHKNKGSYFFLNTF